MPDYNVSGLVTVGGLFAVGDRTVNGGVGAEAELSSAYATPGALGSAWLMVDGAAHKNNVEFFDHELFVSSAFGALYATSLVVACSGANLTGNCTSGFAGFGSFDSASRPYSIPCNTAAVQLVPWVLLGNGGSIQFAAIVYNNTTAGKAVKMAFVIPLTYATDPAAGLIDYLGVEYRTVTDFGVVTTAGAPGTAGWLTPFSEAEGFAATKGFGQGFAPGWATGPSLALLDFADANADPFAAYAALNPITTGPALVVIWDGTAASGANSGGGVEFLEGQEGYGDDWQVDVLPL